MAKKSQCAAALGRKGGQASVSKKVGIHSPAYKKKRAAAAKRKTTKRK